MEKERERELEREREQDRGERESKGVGRRKGTASPGGVGPLDLHPIDESVQLAWSPRYFLFSVFLVLT